MSISKDKKNPTCLLNCSTRLTEASCYLSKKREERLREENSTYFNLTSVSWRGYCEASSSDFCLVDWIRPFETNCIASLASNQYFWLFFIASSNKYFALNWLYRYVWSFPEKSVYWCYFSRYVSENHCPPLHGSNWFMRKKNMSKPGVPWCIFPFSLAWRQSPWRFAP
jgi:hypothetical protein